MDKKTITVIGLELVDTKVKEVQSNLKALRKSIKELNIAISKVSTQ